LNNTTALFPFLVFVFPMLKAFNFKPQSIENPQETTNILFIDTQTPSNSFFYQLDPIDEDFITMSEVLNKIADEKGLYLKL